MPGAPHGLGRMRRRPTDGARAPCYQTDQTNQEFHHMKFACSVLVCAGLACAPAFANEPSETTLSAAARAKTNASCRSGDSGFFRDQGLGMKLASQLKFRKKLLSEQIDARVRNGVATLSGGVSSQQIIVLALNIAAEVEGVHCISNFLRVGPPTPAPEPLR
jgi:hypothetical protein